MFYFLLRCSVQLQVFFLLILGGIRKEVYGLLTGMMINAEKKFYTAESELLLEILLQFHKQLGDSELKWQSLDLAAENQVNMKKMKQKLTNFLLRSGKKPEIKLIY